jgi:hypothetical protein
MYSNCLTHLFHHIKQKSENQDFSLINYNHPIVSLSQNGIASAAKKCRPRDGKEK